MSRGINLLNRLIVDIQKEVRSTCKPQRVLTEPPSGYRIVVPGSDEVWWVGCVIDVVRLVAQLADVLIGVLGQVVFVTRDLAEG
jgi:hypothetical protein